MKDITEIFGTNFMLTGDNIDPRDLDFTFYTHEKITNNPDGTPQMKQYYMNYDEGTDTFSDLAVECDYTYTYDAGVLTKRVEDINWYFVDGTTVGVTRQLIQVYS
ncbi:MAG TPA: hypothetical protein VFU15_06530 [Bacteroidia bacterium]|nr:hypothetical protein [Bacteroidia bacterium]